jgi:hypothetical protein
MSDDDFFAGYETNKPDIQPETEPEIKVYPAWVLTSKKPEKTKVMYDVVVDLYDKAVEKIETGNYETATDVTLKKTKVCDAIPFLNGRSALKNHPLIEGEIEVRNEKLAKLILKNVERQGKSKVRKTKAMVETELEDYKEDYVAKTQTELDRLINSELLVSQSDALNLIATYKKDLAEIREELAEAKYANTKLQDENRKLQERLFTEKPKLTIKK